MYIADAGNNMISVMKYGYISNIQILAGTGVRGYTGDDIVNTVFAYLNQPEGVLYHAESKNLYISDSYNSRD